MSCARNHTGRFVLVLVTRSVLRHSKDLPLNKGSASYGSRWTEIQTPSKHLRTGVQYQLGETSYFINIHFFTLVNVFVGSIGEVAWSL